VGNAATPMRSIAVPGIERSLGMLKRAAAHRDSPLLFPGFMQAEGLLPPR